MPLLLFSIVMLCIYLRPFRIPLWAISLSGAILAYFLEIVSPKEVLFVINMVLDSSLVLVFLIILTLSLEKIGFFSFLAQRILNFLAVQKEGEGIICKTSSLFVFMVLFGAFLATFFANDGAILVLTPLCFALFKHSNTNFKDSIKAPLIIFLLFMAFISDFASNGLVVSNLTNILVAQHFEIPFLKFFVAMLLPQSFAIIASLVIFWLLLGRNLNSTLSFTKETNTLSKFEIYFCFSLLLLLPLLASLNILPLFVIVGILALSAFCYAIFIKKVEPLPLLKSAPFSVVVFSLGLFIVVYGLKNGGILELL